MPMIPRCGTRSLAFRGAVCAAVAALAAGCSKEAPPPARQAPEVTVVTVTPQTIPFTPAFVAQTESSRQVNIVARVSGFLERIAYQEGDLVKQGQLMFTLDPKPFVAQLNVAKGELESQQARLDAAKANFDRVKPLTEQDALSLADLDKAKSEYDAARAGVFGARAKVEEAQLNLSYTTINSPVTGLASRALQRQGAYVNATADSAKLTYVAAIEPIWVNFSVSQNQMAKWSAAQKKGEIETPPNDNFDVEIELPGGIRYPHRGKISFTDPSFSQDTGTFVVRAVLPNPKQDLRPGMFVTAHVYGAKRPNAIVVPQLSVQQGSNGHLVYVINDKNIAEIRPVIVGDYYGDKDLVILGGLRAGDRVVVDGVMKTVPGQPVKIVAPGAPATPTPGAKAAEGKAPEPAKK